MHLRALELVEEYTMLYALSLGVYWLKRWRKVLKLPTERAVDPPKALDRDLGGVV